MTSIFENPDRLVRLVDGTGACLLPFVAAGKFGQTT